jgi:hypothetical protein
MGYASGSTPARQVFWEFRNRRVFVAQVLLICTICFILKRNTPQLAARGCAAAVSLCVNPLALYHDRAQEQVAL